MGFFSVLLPFVLNSSSAFACSCSEQSSLERFKGADAVFAGTVVRVRELKTEPKYLTTFKVEKTWKGGKAKSIEIRNHAEGSMCGGFRFNPGTKNLVYASYSKDAGGLVTGICGGFQDYEPDSRAVKWLESSPSQREKIDRDERRAALYALRMVPDLANGKIRGFKIVSFNSPENPLEKAGLKAGDVLLAADGAALTTPQDATDFFERANSGKDMTLKVEREGKTLTLLINSK